MKTIGFVKSEMANEERRAILPKHLTDIKNKEAIFIEEGYGDALGVSDADYQEAGARIVSREEALSKDIVCDLKVGRASYLEQLGPRQTIFGWVHAENNPQLLKTLLKQELTVIAWEEMFAKGRHVFWKNNQLAGEAAIFHAFTLFGKLPKDCHVALIGRGNVALGAYKILSALGAEVKVYNRETVGGLTDELGDFDVVVNGVLWDKSRDDHLIAKKDLQKMKNGSMIIDVSADEAGAIETSKPTTFDQPTYVVDGVLHYVVMHTPTIFHRSVSVSISEEVAKYIDPLVEGKVDTQSVLAEAEIVRSGQIIDKKLKN